MLQCRQAGLQLRSRVKRKGRMDSDGFFPRESIILQSAARKLGSLIGDGIDDELAAVADALADCADAGGPVEFEMNDAPVPW